MLSIPEAVAQIKGRFPDSIPETLVQRLAQEVGHRWRDRDLGPVVTTYLFLQQILHGNIAITELRRLTDTDFSAPAYCQARARWPRTLLGRLQRAVTQTLASTTEVSLGELWHGHRVYLLDGSSFSMPDTPELPAHFGQPTGQAAGCGFPVAHLMTRFDARTGYLMETAAAPLRRSDLASTAVLHAGLCPGDVLIGDRAFGSYAHLAVGLKRGIHGLYRAHQKQIVCFRPHRAMSRRGETGKPRSRWLKRLGQHDQLVEYFKPSKRPSWLTAEEYAQLPDSLVVRAVRYRIKEPGRRTREVTLVTTLLDPEQYSAKALAKLYGLRWVVETNRKHLKQTLKMDLLRCTTVEGVLKELTVFVLIDNLVRRVMCAAARRQRVAPERISFVDAWRWLRYARPGEAVPELVVNPERPGRFEPRVRKRRPKEFPVMKKPRAELRKALKQQKPAA